MMEAVPMKTMVMTTAMMAVLAMWATAAADDVASTEDDDRNY